MADQQASWTRADEHAEPVLPDPGARLASAGILLVLRRMRAPLITLIVIFAVSALGLSLIPGRDAAGRTDHLSLFEAFYVMSYTATTIGFGEIPHPFTPAQRMWVTFAIFLSVIGWAYAIGSLLALMRDRAFQRALAKRRFAREVGRIGEPFLLLVGYGHATRLLARSLDEMGRRFVVVDGDEDLVASVDLDLYHAEVPALHADVRDTAMLVLAGLGHPGCEGVVTLTGDDDTNLDVTMTAGLLRPSVPVIARTSSREVGERMRTFRPQEVLNPLDRFGDHLRIALRSPAAYQLMIWLTSAPGTPLPERHSHLGRGRWVVCGYGRFGRELVADLRAEGVDVTVVRGRSGGDDPGGYGDPGEAGPDDERLDTESIESGYLADFDTVVAATESDTTNLWVAEHARRANPNVHVVALQNDVANSPLYEAVRVDFGMVPAEVIAHEVLARIASPVLMRFLPQVPQQGEEWAARTLDRLVERCGDGTPYLWGVTLTEDGAPALMEWVEHGEVTVGDLFRSPTDRDHPLDALALTRLREGERLITPDDDHVLRPGDQLLVAGRPSARRLLDSTLVDLPTATYVVEGRAVATGALWRRLTGQTVGRGRVGAVDHESARRG